MMLRPSTLFGKLFVGTVLLIVLVLGTCTWLIVRQVDRFHADELTAHLKAEAIAIQHMVRERFDREHATELDRFAKDIGASQGNRIRITMILQDGSVLADSEANPLEMESHANRREVRQALAEGWGQDVHYSRTVSREMKYVAVRLGSAESPLGVVRVSMALRTIGQRREAVQKLIWTITLLGLVAAILFAMGLASLWSKPIRRITAIAHSMSGGNLSARARIRGDDEMTLLARSLNEMREHLADQLETIDRQRRTLESLLAKLGAGVVVAAPDGKIVLSKPAAVRLLGLSSERVKEPSTLVGLPVDQCVSQHELQYMLLGASSRPDADTVQTGSTDVEPAVQKVQIQLDDDQSGELFLLAQASDITLPGFERGAEPSRTGGHRAMGRMLVLTNITELTRTLQVKMDFASNASHELRTPLSAIRAAIETLRNMDLAKDSNSAKRFLGMIDRHSNRMEQMVSDLLALSRIESSPGRFKRQALTLSNILEDLHGRYLGRLQMGKLDWIADVQPGLCTMEANPYLLHLVLDNLVDNAVKFTDAGGRVSVSCQRQQDHEGKSGAVCITVADNGCGIPPEEQDRIFERFYQVERARTRTGSRPADARGTGLGLSIVKHAVAAMEGSVDLESAPGQGTRVTVTIP